MEQMNRSPGELVKTSQKANAGFGASRFKSFSGCPNSAKPQWQEAGTELPVILHSLEACFFRLLRFWT